MSWKMLAKCIWKWIIMQQSRKKFGMMRMARSTFRRLLEISPEDKVAQAARQHMKEMDKIAIIAKYGELNLTSLLNTLFLMMTYGGW